MGSLSIWHWLVLGIVIMLFFGKGRFSDMMGDVAKGIKEFKKGMTDEGDANAAASRPAQRIDAQPTTPASSSASTPVASEEPRQN